VGDRPLLELIVEQLRLSGISRVNITTHYKKDVISDHFGDGSNFGVDIRYIEEDKPLGTAGALSLIDESDDPLLVINGDILTNVNFRAMLDFHREHDSELTVAVRFHETQIPFGVVTTSGTTITGITEKPTVKHLINAGIYLMNQSVSRYIPDGQPFDMPDLIARLVAEDKPVVGFPIDEYWLDIGEFEDYQRALRDIKSGAL
jgi:NDP-sugar pyrophosphorylase family protein